jgi:hypothetical protein
MDLEVELTFASQLLRGRAVVQAMCHYCSQTVLAITGMGLTRPEVRRPTLEGS